MWRNIIGQGLYQATVLLVMLFAGQELLGFDYDKSLTGFESFYTVDETTGDLVPTEKCIHYSMIFNAFVFCQVFNEINSRKLGAKEYNVFKGFFNNFLFQFVIIVTIVVQYLLVQYGGTAIRCAPLTLEQHGICICIGAFSLIHALFVKAFLPVSWFARWHMNEQVMTDEEESHAFTTQFRKSFRNSYRASADHKVLHEGETAR
mmetsp:Transcript_22166/g.16559  ORF Transcript_22166/g.16559 Transcript_22166/m.16559 type:complete len:204 (-) Transcript_22166:41-652(-)